MRRVYLDLIKSQRLDLKLFDDGIFGSIDWYSSRFLKILGLLATRLYTDFDETRLMKAGFVLE